MLNNYTEEECQCTCAFCTEDNVVYAVVGKEVAASGTLHLQAFVHLKKRLHLSGLKVSLRARIHAEMAQGTDDDNKQ